MRQPGVVISEALSVKAQFLQIVQFARCVSLVLVRGGFWAMFINNMDLNQLDGYLYQEQTLSCKAALQNKDLWRKFHELETEMIITKSGRRMFPALRVQLSQLDPNAQYCVLVEMAPVSKCRYKYSSSGGWAPAGAEEAQSPNRIYLHPESPAPGHHWMSQVVTFSRLKLTNTTNPPPGQLVLSSMHRYQPRVIVVRAADPRHIAWSPHAAFSFQETQFIAVTAYQNDRITKLKIDNNPFAKGFRENGQSKCKRKRQQLEDDLEEIVVDDITPKPKRSSLSEASPSPAPDTSDAGSERTSSPEASPPNTHHASSPNSHHASPRHHQPWQNTSLDSSSPLASPSNSYTTSSQKSLQATSPRHLQPWQNSHQESSSPNTQLASPTNSYTSSSDNHYASSPYNGPQLYTYPPVFCMDVYHPYYTPNLGIYPTSYMGSRNFYNPYSLPIFPQDLSVQKAQPLKLTDFSIKTIMGIS